MLTRYRLEFFGWREGELPDPGKLNTAAQLSQLIAALEAGTCGWKRIDDEDFEERKAVIVARADAAGLVLDAPRQQRKDAGTVRGKRTPLAARDANSAEPAA